MSAKLIRACAFVLLASACGASDPALAPPSSVGADAGGSTSDAAPATAPPGIDAGAPDGSAPSPSRSTLGINDVALLFPLAVDGAGMLSATSGATHGPLLPRDVFDAVCTDASTCADSLRLAYDRLRVVSVRLDPCFPSLANAAKGTCRRQVRLVLQPIAGALANDVAVHTIYEIDSSAFDGLVSRVLALRGPAPAGWATAPLDVHALMRAEGLAGPFATGLAQELLARVGRDNLVRVARMDFAPLPPVGVTWTFAAVDVGPTGATLGNVAMTPASPFEQLANDATGAAVDNARILSVGSGAPSAVKTPEDLGPLYAAQDLHATPPSDTVLWSAYEAALRIENPTIRTVPEIDCVSCHLATSLRTFVERRGFADKPTPARYVPTSAAMAVLTSEETTLSALSFRAFGYFTTKTAISQRTVNDAAAIVDYLRAQP